VEIGGDGFPLRFLIQVDQPDRDVILFQQGVISEFLEAFTGMIFIPAFGDQDLGWRLWAGEEKIDGATDGIGVRGGELASWFLFDRKFGLSMTWSATFGIRSSRTRFIAWKTLSRRLPRLARPTCDRFIGGLILWSQG
jgi:hypothetical protein